MIKIFSHNKILYVSGIGIMHCQEGFPICFSLDYLIKHARENKYELMVCFMTMEKELIQSGVNPDTCTKLIKSQTKEMIEKIPESWKDFFKNIDYLGK